ncbi:hypothetical protein HY947_02600 [Candidatus Gottesmanbacteria bacterium]|nr:hypothetical protein [Candidatus Gottesmanbacteria bacterium]
MEFVAKNGSKLIVFTLAVVLLIFLEKFPYLNILLSYPFTWNLFVILFFLLVVLFKPTESFSFFSSLVFLCFSAIFSIFRKDMAAQGVGNIAVYLLIFGFLQIVLFKLKVNHV